MKALGRIFFLIVFAGFASEAALGQLADPNTLSGVIDALEDQIEAEKKGFLNNTDLPGSTLDSPDLEAADPALCAALCAKDDYCKAWTFRRPRPGVRYRCDLKSDVPQMVSSPCCVSGLKAAAAAVAGEKICDLDDSKMTGPNELCHSYYESPPGAEDRVRTVHIVNSYNWEKLGWTMPKDWTPQIYNICPHVYELEMQKCDQMKKSK